MKRWLVLAAIALSMACSAAPKGKIVGVAVEGHDQVVVFATEAPWEGCQGGAAYKEGGVGCWVVIDEEDVIFVMWKDGEMSNIPAAALRACSTGEECKQAVVR